MSPPATIDQLRQALAAAVAREGLRPFAHRKQLSHAGVYEAISGRCRNPGAAYYHAVHLNPPPHAGCHGKTIDRVTEAIEAGEPVCVNAMSRKYDCSRHTIRKYLAKAKIRIPHSNARTWQRKVAAAWKRDESAAWKDRAEHRRVKDEIDKARFQQRGDLR